MHLTLVTNAVYLLKNATVDILDSRFRQKLLQPVCRWMAESTMELP
jgi:hypothetical protein